MKQKEWFPTVSKGHMKLMLKKQGILSWLDTCDIPKEYKAALIEDILEFINRACRAVELTKPKRK